MLTDQHPSPTRPRVMRIVCLFLLWVGASTIKTHAEGFAFFRYDDDFRYLSDPANRMSWYDDFKYIPLGDSPGSYLSLGADLRERVESYDEGYFGLADAPHTTYDLSRAQVDADAHVDKVRVFVQLGSYEEWGRKPGAIPTDDGKGDVQQAFVDYAATVGPGTLTLRGGRFEMKFGEGLIVSPREGPNIRQAWDGAWAFYDEADIRVDMLAARPVTDKPGYFNDTNDNQQALWGAYVTDRKLAVPNYKADVYYFGNVNHSVSLYTGAAPTGEEHTSTFGGRFYGQVAAFDSTSEAAFQTGHFAGRGVRAFAIHNELGWTWQDVTWKPRVGLRVDVLSGSSHPAQGTVQTFNALYPNVSYGSDAVLEAPANLIEGGLDLHAHPSPSVDVEYTGGGLWRYSIHDAFYASPLFPLIPGDAGAQRYIGTEQQIAGNWAINPHLSVRASVVHFSVGQFVVNARGRDTNFAMFYVFARI